jgi:hypothetical protein
MQNIEDLEQDFLKALNKPITSFIKKVYPKQKEHTELIKDMELELEEIKRIETEKFLKKLDKKLKKVFEIDDKITQSQVNIKKKKMQIESSTNDINQLIYSGKYDSKIKPLKSYFVTKNDFKIEKGHKKKINFGGAFVQKYNPSDDLQISDEKLPLISRRIFKIYKNYKREIKAQFPQGVEYVMKVIFKYIDEETGVVKTLSKVFRKHQSIEKISKKIKRELIDIFIHGYILPILSHIDFYVFPLNNAGGCSSCYT